MKALASLSMQPLLKRWQPGAEPAAVAAPPVSTRPVEIRRFLRTMRENRRYNLSRDFIF